MVEYRTTATYRDAEYAPQELVALAEALGHHGGNCMADGTTVWLWCTVSAADVTEAVTSGLAVLVPAYSTHLAHPGELVGVEAVTSTYHTDRIAHPQMPGAMTQADVARLLGRTRQQVFKLARTDPQFPKPVAQTSAGPLYWKPDVEQFARDWHPRRGGARPRRATAG